MSLHIGSDNDLVPSGNSWFAEPKWTQIYVKYGITWPQWANNSWRNSETISIQYNPFKFH